MSTQIVNPSLALEALKQTGYRTTGSAIAELVDNSIEANATDIDIISASEETLVKRKVSLQVKKIALLDNGEGMDKETLSQCLSLGWGTRLDGNTKGLGKFGFGLKGSSISQARRVEVYSWQNIDWKKEDFNSIKVNMASLDMDRIRDEKLIVLDEVEKKSLPQEIVGSFGYKIKKHHSGTLVIWSELDSIKFKKSIGLISQINKELCRIYRHFLHGGEFGDIRNINIQELNLKSREVNTIELKPNDPLYLMTPNNLKDHENEATNVEHQKAFSSNIEYEDRDGNIAKSKVVFKMSIAKPEIQALLGGSATGQHYENNTGISFIRAGREIDFDTFGFLSNSEPRHRWWGMEICFNPELDELFGVTNSKQNVLAIKRLTKVQRSEFLNDDDLHYSEKLLIEINKIIDENITEMMKIIKGRGKNKRAQKERDPIKDKINEELNKRKETRTESKEHSEQLTDAQKIQERTAILLADNTSLKPDDAKIIAEETIDYKVDLLTDGWPGNLFLARKPVANASIGIINRDTAFYDKFWTHLEESEDQKGYEALQIVMMALIRAEDELQVLMNDKEALETFRERWSDNVDQLLKVTD